MAYSLYIERVDPNGSGTGSISLQEWMAAVSAVGGARTATSDHSAANPQTGEVVSIARHDGDVEVLLNKEKIWAWSFRWSNGAGVFSPTEIGSRSDPVWVVATALAGRLEAAILGDEGERYDLATGETIDD